jgi:hypothetical protein
MQALGVDRLLIYAGGFGDHIECDSNPEEGVSTFVIESLMTGTTIYYCLAAEGGPAYEDEGIEGWSLAGSPYLQGLSEKEVANGLEESL